MPDERKFFRVATTKSRLQLSERLGMIIYRFVIEESELADRPKLEGSPIIWLDELNNTVPNYVGHPSRSVFRSTLTLAEEVPDHDKLLIDGKIPLTEHFLQYIQFDSERPLMGIFFEPLFRAPPPPGLRVRVTTAQDGIGALREAFEVVSPDSLVRFPVMGGNLKFPDYRVPFITKKQAKDACVNMTDFWKKNHDVEDNVECLSSSTTPHVFLDGDPVLTTSMAQEMFQLGGKLQLHDHIPWAVNVVPTLPVDKLEFLDKLTDDTALARQRAPQRVVGLFRYPAGESVPWSVAVTDPNGSEQVLNRQGPMCFPDYNGDVDASFEPVGDRAEIRLTRPDYEPICLPIDPEQEEPRFMCGAAAPTSVEPTLSEDVPNDRRVPDHTLLIIEATPKPGEDAPEPGSLDTTAENLARFVYDQRTNWPGAVQDLRSVAETLREFGGASFYVKDSPNGKWKLIFRGNPRKPGTFITLRKVFRGTRYNLENPRVVQLGIGAKNALKAGSKATVVSFILVAGIDAVAELLEDEPSLVRLGITLASDAVKLGLSLLAGIGATAAVTALTAGATVPVVAVSAVGFFVCLMVGLKLDEIDNGYGVTKWLQDRALEARAWTQDRAKRKGEEIKWGMAKFLRQMEWCAMNPYRCLL